MFLRKQVVAASSKVVLTHPSPLAKIYPVKIAILAKFNHHRGEIVLERLEVTTITPGLGATLAQSSSRSSLEPTLQQIITITRDNTTDLASYNVTSGALVLRFVVLFL